MNQYVLPLEVLGLLLTAALIGAVIIAMREQESEVRSQKPETGDKSEATDSIVNRQSSIVNPP
jgi:hypothetical protein